MCYVEFGVFFEYLKYTMHLIFNNLIKAFQGLNSKHCSNILAAILENGCHSPQGWPKIQICL